MSEKEKFLCYHNLLEKIESRVEGEYNFAKELYSKFDDFEIESFYKYSSFNEKYTPNILKYNTFHLSPLDILNDPNEYSSAKFNNPSKSPKIELDGEVDKLTEATKTLIKFLNDGDYIRAKEFLKKNTLICSLTTDGLSNHMWAYYASDRTGVCIEYDAKTIFAHTGGKLAPILYNQEVPSVDTTSFNSFLKSMRKVSFTKKDTWSHEKEWRVSKIVLDKDYYYLSVEDKLSIQNDPNYKFKPKSITVGDKMHNTTKSIMLDLCRKNEIPLYSLVIDPNSYDFSRIVEYNPNE